MYNIFERQNVSRKLNTQYIRSEYNLIDFIRDESFERCLKLAKRAFENEKTMELITELSIIIHYRLPIQFYNKEECTFLNVVIDKIQLLEKRNVIYKL